MNLYLRAQTYATGYDTYSAVIVAAETEEEARNIHPASSYKKDSAWEDDYDTWCRYPKDVTVKYLGIADSVIKKGVVLSSFHAG